MDCKLCKIEMDYGIVLDDGSEPHGLGMPPIHITAQTMRQFLHLCWKCPKCGHSERIDGYQQKG